MPDLYARTYMTLLRSSGTVRVHALQAAHARMRSSLHALAARSEPDAGAFIYAIQRLPLCVSKVSKVVSLSGGKVRAYVLTDAALSKFVWSDSPTTTKGAQVPQPPPDDPDLW